MLKSSSLCLNYSSNLGTFWLKIEQFWPFEEILFLVMAAILDTGWPMTKNKNLKGPPKDHFSSLVEIGSVVSSRRFFLTFHPGIFYNLHNRSK